MKKIKKGRAVFSVVNYMFLSLLALLCILPLLTILAMSFFQCHSGCRRKGYTMAGRVYDNGLSICY